MHELQRPVQRLPWPRDVRWLWHERHCRRAVSHAVAFSSPPLTGKKKKNTRKLRDSFLKFMPSSIGNLHSLMSLRFHNVNLSLITAEISGLQNLRMMFVVCSFFFPPSDTPDPSDRDLANNNLPELPDAFYSMTRLESLCVSSFRLQTKS